MTGKALIMIVDDDADDRFFFRRAVKIINPPNECMEATDGVDALEQLKAAAVLPDYIFLDLNMPRMDGRACLAALKKDSRLKHIPVVIYSTSTYQKDIDLAASLGAVHYLAKPADITQLPEAIRNAIQAVEEKLSL